MIVKLKGFIEDWFEDFVDLDVKGVVYRVFVPRNINKISEKGSLVTFFLRSLKKVKDCFLVFQIKMIENYFLTYLKFRVWVEKWL